MLRRRLGRLIARLPVSDALRQVQLQLVPVQDEGWQEERAYWRAQLESLYRREYGLGLDPVQLDERCVPPADLVQAIQTPTKSAPDTFFATGYRNAVAYQQELLAHGWRCERFERVLEFGVGLGRLIIHLFPFPAHLYGCDITPQVVRWTQARHGARVQVELNRVRPPLSYPNDHFDYVYANSVFTHIPVELVPEWAEELGRVIRPGGALIFSVIDPNHYLRGFTYRDWHASFEAPGGNTIAREAGVFAHTYLPPALIQQAFGGRFQLLEVRQHFRDQTHVVCRAR